MIKPWVISLGGSRIVPNDIDVIFIKKFKDLLNKHKDKKFVVVCGGGRTARRYISAIQKFQKSQREESLEGIEITRLNARLMMSIFEKEANKELPKNMKQIKNLLRKNRIVFCGALRWEDQNTSDGTSAKIAEFFKAKFINLTNVKGLYSEDPHKNKNAKFIPEISWEYFLQLTKKIKYKAGQHFVLDLVAAEEISKKKITTYIIGSLNSLDNILNNKKYIGTTITK